MARHDHPENPLTAFRTMDGSYGRYLAELADIFATIGRHLRPGGRTGDGVPGRRGTADRHTAHAGPRLEALVEEFGEDPGIAGVARRVDQCDADVAVVGGVPVTAAPPLVEVDGDQHVRAVLADRARDVTAQRQAVLDDAVRVAEEVHVPHADRGPHLFLDAHGAGGLRFHGGDPGLAAAHHGIGDGLAPRGPPGDRAGGPLFQVVGVRDDAQRALPVLRHRCVRLGHAASPGARVGRVEALASACRHSSKKASARRW